MTAARTPLYWLLLLTVVFVVPAANAFAHPLGNFTVNHYSRVEVGSETVRVFYVLDLAEIPSVQESRAVGDWDAYKQRKMEDIARQLELTINGSRIDLHPTEVRLSHPLGQGDIPLVRLESWLQGTAPSSTAPGASSEAIYRDRNDPARIGWREIVVRANEGAVLGESSVPNQDVSNELRNYPDALLQNPLDLREARWTFSLGAANPAGSTDVARAAVARPTDQFATLVTATDLNPTVIMLALLGAAILGGMHAASPGHGKSVMAAYIVGTSGTIVHALALALSVTLAHTTGVLALGLLVVVASNLIVPEQLFPWLTLLSGALVLVVGGAFLGASVFRRGRPEHQHEHEHEHDHDHDHDHAHPHASRRLAPTWRSLFALGLAGGMVPSGSALVVLLSSIALGRLGFGLVLIVAFGLGMAVVLVSTGVLLVHAGRFMLRLFPDDAQSPTRQRIAAAVPIASASVMALLGCATVFQGLSQLGILVR